MFRAATFHGEYPPEELRNIIEREQARTDRTGMGFSLLVFRADQPGSDHVLARVAGILRRRLRLTDVFGRLDDSRIGAVLPATPALGAWKVAEDVCSAFSGESPRPNCEVYCYPSDWLSREPLQAKGRGRLRSDEKPVRPLEVLFVQPLPLWKRCLDVLGASVGLILSSPLLLAAAVAVKLSSPGPVFFRQQRTGRGGKPFTMYKLRSMVIDAEEKKKDLLPLNEVQGPAFKIKADPRVTAVGQFLRSTSIDELPQLWNVLKGDMSLVGPRPLVHAELPEYEIWQRHRLEVTPGLTCIWQVSGRSTISFEDWMRMDLRYIRSISLWHDLKLILQTVPALLTRKGAS